MNLMMTVSVKKLNFVEMQKGRERVIVYPKMKRELGHLLYLLNILRVRFIHLI